MKKNASCKSIRTNITSPTNALKHVPKRPLNLDLLSCKNQAPKIQFPASTKTPHEHGLRRKIFSNSKLLQTNNENISQANIHPNSPLAESSRAYDQLKNKITNLEGRLVEIKKNFELSFQKRSEKSKVGKENPDSLRQKQKSCRLILTKHDDRSKHDKTKEASKSKECRDNLVRRAPTQSRGEKNENMLQDYVTTFSCQSPTMLIQCTSDANLFKPHKFTKGFKQPQRYYIDAISNAFSVNKLSSFDQLCKNHLSTSLEILQFIKNANKGLPQAPNPRPLPPTQKPTLIFDLDQTLIHCNESTNMPCDVLLPIRFPNGAMVKAGVNVRPYARECLQQLSRDYELIVFTASHECYANVIIDYIDQKRVISQRYFRDSCWKSQEGFYVKDLRVIDRDLKNVLLIDNAAYSYCFQLDNGVPIVPFYDNKADLELKSFVGYVKTLGAEPNIRQRNANVMRLGEYWSMREPKELLSRLYEWQN